MYRVCFFVQTFNYFYIFVVFQVGKYTLSSRYGLVQSSRKRSTNCRLRSSVEIISGDDFWTHQSQAWRVRKRTRSVSRRAAESLCHVLYTCILHGSKLIMTKDCRITKDKSCDEKQISSWIHWIGEFKNGSI